MEIINRQAQKVVAVAYRRWSFTRGSNCKALTGKILVFALAVAYKSWSYIEDRLYLGAWNRLYPALKVRKNRQQK